MLTTHDYLELPFGSGLHDSFNAPGLPGTRATALRAYVGLSTALRAYVGLSTEGEDPNAPLPTPGPVPHRLRASAEENAGRAGSWNPALPAVERVIRSSERVTCAKCQTLTP
ncbi:hypothetical protein [Kitasatospora sp. NPDC059673]|uniref:hypothetical protein n=1 Tax=Kitasatospora sp. NPDC059673 TaxID=3346901 RepID=UPI0036885BB7